MAVCVHVGYLTTCIFQVCLALRFFASGSMYTDIGDAHGVHKSTVCRTVRDISDYLTAVHERYIRWPSR